MSFTNLLETFNVFLYAFQFPVYAKLTVQWFLRGISGENNRADATTEQVMTFGFGNFWNTCLLKLENYTW